MKVLVTGAAGQLGQALLKAAPKGLEAIGRRHGEFDITDSEAVNRQLDALRPAVLINAAAFTAVERAEAEREQAWQVNAQGPELLARACRNSGIRFLHVSTDFVFDGMQAQLLPTDAPTGPLNVYGTTKLEGERRVCAVLPEALIVRTSWLYGAQGHTFLSRILERLSSREQPAGEAAVVVDQIGAPTWVRSLAAALWSAVGQPDLHGVHHWCDSGVASRYDFAMAIRDEALALGLLGQAAVLRPVATADFPTPVRRPAMALLDKRLLEQALGWRAAHWRENLRLAMAELVRRPC